MLVGDLLELPRLVHVLLGPSPGGRPPSRALSRTRQRQPWRWRRRRRQWWGRESS